MTGKFWMGAVAAVLAAGAAQAAGAQEVSAAPPIDSSITMFYYDDLAAPEAFYGGLLGLEKTFEEDWAKIYKVTETSSVGLIRPGEGAYHTTRDKNAVMLSIVTSDVEGWYRRLKAAKVKFLKDIENPDVPIRAFLVEDPGGYTVEFFQWQDAE